jgi:RNA polymerase sigma-70 factor (ECF subfamily)
MNERSESDHVAVFARERPRLVGFAYRLLGSVTDAEDVVQDAWFRWDRADRDSIERPAAWLTTVVGRLGLDRLRARQRERADYVGPWLPEPLVREPDPSEFAEVSDSLTTAFLILLERLNPLERLVVLLADVFGESFSAVAEIAGRTEPAVRQIAVRARRKLHDGERPLAQPSPTAEQREVAARFLRAAVMGDRDAVVALLHPDVVLLSDGGAERHAARRPVVGAHRVERFVLNLARRLGGTSSSAVDINGAPGVVVRVGSTPVFVLGIEVTEGRVQRMTVVLNPDKLQGVDHPIELV